MLLRVRIPEAPSDGDAAGQCRHPWALHDSRGALIQSGADTIAALPRAQHVELIAPASRVLLTRTALPARGRQRTRQILRFAIEDRITEEPDRVHVALGMQGAGGEHAVAIVEREWLRGWIAAFTAAGHVLRSMQVETGALPAEPDAWSVLWRSDGGFVRTGAQSGMALDAGSPTAPPAALQLALQEAEAGGSAPRALAVYADGEDEAVPDLEAWSARLRMPCENAGRWDWARAPDGPVLELLQGEFAPAGRTADWSRFRPAIAIAALIVIVQVFGTLVHWATLRYEKSRLQSEMHALFRKSFPDAQAIVDPPLQMQRSLAALRRAAGEAQAGDFLPLLARFSSALATAPQARVRNVTYERAKLLVDVAMGSKAEAEALLQRLKASGEAAVLEAVDPRSRGVEARFALNARAGA